MKKLSLALLILFMFLGRDATGQSGGEPDNYVVVIGAFSIQGNADRLVKQSKKYNLSPSVELNKIRNLYYVYVLQTGDKAAAVTEALRLREATAYSDAWVYNGTFGELVVSKEPVVVEPPPVEVVEVAAPAPVVPVVAQLTHEEKIRDAVKSKNMTLQKGETETLDYIYFFRDAAILRPESRFEVDHLVRILKENPGEKIVIHGHTNGNDKGKIIRRKDAASDFFSLENTIEDFGSAEKLSELRASVIRDYLVANGIEKRRMSIKAWGGKKALFEVDDEKAEANVRVEIEVLNKE